MSLEKSILGDYNKIRLVLESERGEVGEKRRILFWIDR